MQALEPQLWLCFMTKTQPHEFLTYLLYGLQLAHFKEDPENKEKVMDKGLWRYTRHPNYFGDSAVWWGYGFICLASGSYLPVLGSVLMTGFIIKVSGVALLEKSLKEQKPQFKEYIEKTSAFLPWFPKE